MSFLFLKFLHVGAMFLATALAVGPCVVLYLVARGAEPDAIRTAFGYAPKIFRAGAACYGLGILFGAAAALTGAIDLTQGWLITAYVLVGVLIVTNFGFERWTRRVGSSLDDAGRLRAIVAERRPLWSLSAMVLLTLAIVFVMVTKASVIG